MYEMVENRHNTAEFYAKSCRTKNFCMGKIQLMKADEFFKSKMNEAFT